MHTLFLSIGTVLFLNASHCLHLLWPKKSFWNACQCILAAASVKTEKKNIASIRSNSSQSHHTSSVTARKLNFTSTAHSLWYSQEWIDKLPCNTLQIQAKSRKRRTVNSESLDVNHLAWSELYDSVLTMNSHSMGGSITCRQAWGYLLYC